MLQLRNQTPFDGAMVPCPDPSGVESVYVVVKGSFTVGKSVDVAAEQQPLCYAAEYYGDPGASSLRVPGDVSLMKPGTDVLLIGSAYAPGGHPAWQADVSLSVGPLAKSVRVSGERVWDVGAGGSSVSWVAPFERLPLVWERAYGGTDSTDAGPAAEPRNPVGVGFHARGGAKPTAGAPLPNIEDPAALISSWKDAPAPAGVGPIAPHWEPRKSHAGTYDDAWLQNRAPYLPSDFDPRFFQLAPAGQFKVGYLRGGEPVTVIGATPSGRWEFELPAVQVTATFRLDNVTQPTTAVLDTVLLEPDSSRVTLVWRSVFACDKKTLRVRDVEIRCDADPRIRLP